MEFKTTSELVVDGVKFTALEDEGVKHLRLEWDGRPMCTGIEISVTNTEVHKLRDLLTKIW